MPFKQIGKIFKEIAKIFNVFKFWTMGILRTMLYSVISVLCLPYLIVKVPLEAIERLFLMMPIYIKGGLILFLALWPYPDYESPSILFLWIAIYGFLLVFDWGMMTYMKPIWTLKNIIIDTCEPRILACEWNNIGRLFRLQNPKNCRKNKKKGKRNNYNNYTMQSFLEALLGKNAANLLTGNTLDNNVQGDPNYHAA